VCEGLFPACDVFIAVAAVADYRPKVTSPQKLKKTDCLILELEPTVDILKMLGARKRPEQSVIGFAAETADVEASARRKLADKNLDWIVANEVGRAGVGMESDFNAVTLLSRDGRRVTLPAALKTELARSIIGELFSKE
jgi:phosphopantothenoylcysteine synthetase/decarboxylase